MTGDTVRIPLSALLVTATMLEGSLSTEAHHSFTGAYNVRETITITGTIVQIALRSPHSFFYIESRDAEGIPQQWAIEGAAGDQFSQHLRWPTAGGFPPHPARRRPRSPTAASRCT